MINPVMARLPRICSPQMLAEVLAATPQAPPGEPAHVIARALPGRTILDVRHALMDLAAQGKVAGDGDAWDARYWRLDAADTDAKLRAVA